MPGPETALLALETATSPGGVALLRGGEVVERALPRDVSTAESLLPALDALLAEAGLGLPAVGAFAVSIGPGSFTGLRIGVATVKGLAFGTDLPVAPVPTLEALALGAGGEAGPVVAALDARRGEVYAAAFGLPGLSAQGWLPEGLYDAEALIRSLPARCRLVGEGARICGASVRAALGPGIQVQPEPAAPAAGDVARLGAGLVARGEALPAHRVRPRYVRRAEAEVRRTGRATEL